MLEERVESAIPGLLEANARYAATFDGAELPRPPALRLAILTCMDARIDPSRALGLREGDAHVIRNAGGRASEDALRSLIVSHQFLGVEEILVVHHTDCGMLNASNEELQERLARQLRLHPAETRRLDFMPIDDLRHGIRDDIATIRRSPFIAPGTRISGMIYDVASGRLLPVE